MADNRLYNTQKDLDTAIAAERDKIAKSHVTGTAWGDQSAYDTAFGEAVTGGVLDVGEYKPSELIQTLGLTESDFDQAREAFGKNNFVRQNGVTYYGNDTDRDAGIEGALAEATKGWGVKAPPSGTADATTVPEKPVNTGLAVAADGKPITGEAVAGGLTDQQKLAFAELQRLQGADPMGVSASVSASGGGGARISQYSGKATWNANGGRSQFDARITRGGGGGVDVSASAGAGGRPFVGSGFAGAGGADGTNGMVPSSERARLRRIEALQRSLGIPTDEELRKEEMQKRINFAKASAAKTAAGDERRAQEAAARREERFRKSVEAVGGAGSYDKLQELHRWQQENKANWGDMTQEALGMTKAQFNAMTLKDKMDAGEKMKAYFDSVGVMNEFARNPKLEEKMAQDRFDAQVKQGAIPGDLSDSEKSVQLELQREYVSKNMGSKFLQAARKNSGLDQWKPPAGTAREEAMRPLTEARERRRKNSTPKAQAENKKKWDEWYADMATIGYKPED